MRRAPRGGRIRAVPRYEAHATADPDSRAVGPSDDFLFVRGDVELPRAPFQLPKLAET